MHEWEVVIGIGNRERVKSDAWQIGPNGDLVFLNGDGGRDTFFVRAFATGTWKEVQLYA